MTSVRRQPARVGLFVMVCALALVSATYAQRGYGQRSFREGSFPPQFPPEDFADGGFTICKLMYTQVRREAWGIGWLTDYPYAAVNLMIRASELTKIHVSWDADHTPHPWVVRLTDAALFQCPMIMASDVGTMGISDVEAARLREYLLKGGFLWVDDFWGPDAWEQWVSQIRKVFDSTRVPDRRCPSDTSDIPHLCPRGRRAAGHEHPVLARIRRHRDIGARCGQRRGPHPRHQRRARPDHGLDDPQHRPRRFLGARGRGSRIFLSVLPARLLGRHQRPRVHVDALTRHTPTYRPVDQR